MVLREVLGGALAALTVLPTLDALGRLLRLVSPRQEAGEETFEPRRLVALVPSRAEGTLALSLCRDLRREGIEPFVILDGGGDATAFHGEAFRTLAKEPAGPTKAAALAFAAEHLRAELDASDFVLVFDADMRLPERWREELRVPVGTEVFQAPARPAGTPPAGAARVEAFSLAVATRVEDLERDVRGLPVRLRGKAMGFTPGAFRLAFAEPLRTMAEDSEATVRLLAHGVRIRALAAPTAFDEPAGASSLAAPRARWFASHLKLAVVGLADFLRLARRSPGGAFVLGCDLYLRPRALLLPAVLTAFVVSLFVLPVGAVAAAISAVALVSELLYLRRARKRLGFPPDIPAVTAADLLATAGMWMGAVLRGIAQPGRWHRARPARESRSGSGG